MTVRPLKAPRIYCPQPLQVGLEHELCSSASRHVQVLRMQPGQSVQLFGGNTDNNVPLQAYGYFEATIVRISRSSVTVQVQSWQAMPVVAEPDIRLAVVVPANDRMDWLVEKATELGASHIQPLLSSRSVWRAKDERAQKKQQHWQAIAVSACEQSLRLRVPPITPIQNLAAWLHSTAPQQATQRWCLSLQDGASTLRDTAVQQAHDVVWLLSGPEGGLDAAEEAMAYTCGFLPVSLGTWTLRADTAPLAALAALMLR